MTFTFSSSLVGRYCGANRISYTEMEYSYALSLGKPTIAFIQTVPDNQTDFLI
jgi:hypothetical protein